MAKPLISPESIYDAALTILETGGASALTARALTATLHCSTKTLYQQVGNRDQMIRGTVAHAFALMKLEFRPGPDITSTIHGWATTLRSAFLAHPALAGLLDRGDRGVIVDYAMPLVQALGGEGLDDRAAVHVAGVLSHVTMSMILTDAHAPGEWDHPEVFETTLRWLLVGLLAEYPQLR